MPSRTVLFVTRADPSALRLAGSCAQAAAAAGERVDVFLFAGAVSAVVAAREEADHPAAPLVRARAMEGVRLLACSASLVEERVNLDEAAKSFDAVVGWPTVIEWSRGVVDRYCF